MGALAPTCEFLPSMPQLTTQLSTPFFFRPKEHLLWDTWAYYHDSQFYLYYLTRAFGVKNWDGVGLATSDDGVHWKDHGKVIEKAADAVWLGSGAVWPAIDREGRTEKFIMNFSEFRGSEREGRQTIFFAESEDLIHWTRLGSQYEFCQDERWYESRGRWDNLWTIPRPAGGYYGYWAATPKDKRVGLGFGESADGLVWRALDPAILLDVPLGPPILQSPEVGAVAIARGKYYALPGLDDLASVVNNDFTEFHPGHTTVVADSPFGPFAPSARNRRLLVGNGSYFLRFVDTPDGVLVNHQSWEVVKGGMSDVVQGTCCMTPLKRAVWDEEGTLRLKWWEKNERAKTRAPTLESPLDTPLDPNETLIWEGVMRLSAAPAGLYLQGTDRRGTGILVHRNGLVEYGDINKDGTGFVKRGFVDRDLALRETTRFRLLRRGRITEFYLDDYLMQCYSLPERGTGRVGVLGSVDRFSQMQAWHCP